MVERTIEQHTAISLENLIDSIGKQLEALEKKHFICGYLKNELTNFCDLVGYIPSNTYIETTSYPEHEEIEVLKIFLKHCKEILKNY